MTDTIITKARGALRLSREGKTAGERAAAKAALKRILEKYSLTLEELEALDTDWYKFYYSTPHEQMLLFQLYDQVTGGRESTYLDGDGYVEIRLTPDEFEELTRVREAYLEAWRKAVDDLWRAFVLKHELYAAVSDVMVGESNFYKTVILANSLASVQVPLGVKRRIGK